MTKSQLIAAVLDLPVHERAEVATTLLRSLDEDEFGPELTPNEWSKAWGVEIDGRLDRLDRGETKPLPAEGVFSEMRRRLVERSRGS